MASAKPPGIVSAPRITTLIASLLVSTSSGTNYVTWAPQLGSRLRINHTRLNVIGLAGNVGVYSSGPIWGRIVDKRGPRIPLIGAFVLLFLGYSGVKSFFDAGLPGDAQTAGLSTFSFILLVFCNYMTGSGGNGGLTSSVNSTAKTFPDRARATATGFVLGGFGLSAFVFSTLAHVIFAGNTSAFLQILALGTSLPMIIGCFLVRPIPLPLDVSAGPERGIGALPGAVTSTSALIDDDSRGPLLARESDWELNGPEEPSYNHVRALSRSSSDAISADELPNRRSHGRTDDDLPNITGMQLWKSGDFYLLFTILSILAGTGLMYINNVGTMSQTLYAQNNSQYDEVEAGKWQAMQVSVISIMNFSGRILIGIISDAAKNRFKIPRSYCLVLVSIGVFLSQVAAARITMTSDLWLASAMLGISYGAVFSIMPQICIEWFGLQHFSENWGYLSMSPMVAGNLFMLFFGRNLDAHEPRTSLQSPYTARRENLLTPDDIPRCLEGKDCYVAALYLTMFMTFTCILLSVWAGWREHQRSMDLVSTVPGKRGRSRGGASIERR
ncbi:hypothetical protein AGABI2DRAFT_154754 [Agaricus bisporus var. bisporus H97]|uniref:hypothetical protein n=1 Tax=Agaricus bisporus var. bisporus (strain H97 / ATCC MYA-4626 / FGSC 10389) TaxID=936046 RepID=UPI00029F64B3|nr:hypothetical protein AGABI2DRAFT_154754 [Agaricus bisporus var. bisporus H97]EKV41716.1 hypothetical protein AGABI2DRAFT_154754 [Agaricus bisporus var. bisporus H97]